MTGTEILAQAELYAEDLEVDEAQGLSLINECLLDDLGLNAGLIASKTIIATENTWVALDAAIAEVLEIEKDGNDIPYYGSRYGVIYDGSFDIRDDKIRFPGAGTYIVWGKVLPSAISSLASTPAVNSLWFYPICKYVAYRALLIEDEDDATAPKLRSQYETQKQDVIAKLNPLQPTTKKPPIMKCRPFI